MPRRVLIVSQGDDVGGVGSALVQAINHAGTGEWVARAMRGADNYIQYPADLVYTPERFRAEYKAADVVHCMESFDNVLRAMGLDKPDRPFVLHHHGSALRDGPAVAAWAERLGIPQYVSTIDLEGVRPGLRWIGNPIPVRWLQDWGVRFGPSDQVPFTVATTPTFRSIKGTAEFLAGARRAGAATVVVEREPWIVALHAKAAAHAYFDQLTFGFGLSALEAWSMHRPVMAGVWSLSLLDRMRERWGVVPFVVVGPDPDTIAHAITMLRDPSEYTNAVRRGHEFVEKWHDESVVAAQWERAWSEARALS